jgi:hypothetical protein
MSSRRIPLAKRNPTQKNLYNNYQQYNENNENVKGIIYSEKERKMVKIFDLNIDDTILCNPYNYSKEMIVNLDIGEEYEWDDYIRNLYKSVSVGGFIGLHDIYKYEYLNVMMKYSNYNITASENFDRNGEVEEEDITEDNYSDDYITSDEEDSETEEKQ